MKFDYNTFVSGTKESDVWNLSQSELTPWPSAASDPITVNYTGATNPLAEDRVTETSITNTGEDSGQYYYNIEGTFVYELEGTVSFANGVYTATYTKTLVVAESTVESIHSFRNDMPQYDYEWSGGIALEDVMGKALGELITDGSVIDLDELGNKVTGTSADEIFYLQGGKDKINAKGGADVIFGDFGEDRLTGGAGADTFAFDSVTNSPTKQKADLITDFVSGKDMIDLGLIDAKRVGGSDQAFKFLGETDFSGKAGELIFEHEGHGQNQVTHIYVNVNSDKKADMVITLEGAIDLTASDFNL